MDNTELIRQCEEMLNANDPPSAFAVGYLLRRVIPALRRAQPSEKPEPLTLDELRGMDGEPVWIQESAPYTFAGYKILCSPVVDEYEDVCFEGGDCYYSHDYGKTWLAYRRKPERSGGE